MPTKKDHVLTILADAPLPLAPADVHLQLERRGVETSIGYVNQMLQRLKDNTDEGGLPLPLAEQPRDGRWALTETGVEAASSVAAEVAASIGKGEGATVHAEPGRAFAFEPGSPGGVVVVRIGNAVLQLSLHQTGPELVIPIESFVGESAS